MHNVEAGCKYEVLTSQSIEAVTCDVAARVGGGLMWLKLQRHTNVEVSTRKLPTRYLPRYVGRMHRAVYRVSSQMSSLDDTNE